MAGQSVSQPAVEIDADYLMNAKGVYCPRNITGAYVHVLTYVTDRERETETETERERERDGTSRRGP